MHASVHVSSLSTRKCFLSLLAPSSASPKLSSVFCTLDPVQRLYNTTQSPTLRTLEPTLDRIDDYTRDSFDRDFAFIMDAGQAHTQSDFLSSFNGQDFGHLPAGLQNTNRPLDSLDATVQSQVQQHSTPYQAVMPTSIDPRLMYQTSMDQPTLDQSLMYQTNTNQPSLGPNFMYQTNTNQLFRGQTYPNQLFTGQTNMDQPSAENQTNQLFTSQTNSNQPSAENFMNQTYLNQPFAENFMNQTYPNQPFADHNSVHQTFPTQTSMPPATVPPIGPSKRQVSDTAMVYYNSLTENQKTRIMDQASKHSFYMNALGVGPNYDPVMVYCRYRARKDLAKGVSQTVTTQQPLQSRPEPEASTSLPQPVVTQQPLQSRPEPEVSTSLPQPTGCSPGSPIVIEECAVPAATTPKPKLVDVTDRMYSEYPDENDFIHPAYSMMMWMDKFKEAFQLNRVARSHRWHVREDDRTKFSCTRRLDGVTTVAWQLEAQLNELEHGRAESNNQKEQREEQQTAEEAARKEESERKAVAEAQQKAAEKAARKEESKKRAQANRKQKAATLREKIRKETEEAQQKAAEEAARKEEAERKAAADREQQRREERDTAPQRSKRKATDSEETSSPKKARLDIDPLSEEGIDSLFEERDDGDYNDNDDEEEEDQELVDSCTSLLEMDDDDEEEDQELVDSCTNLLEMNDDDDDGNKQKSVDTTQDESGEEVRDLQYDSESEESEEE